MDHLPPSSHRPGPGEVCGVPRTAVTGRGHGLHQFAGRLHEVLDGLVEVPGWSLSRAEAAESVVELFSALPRVLEVGLRALARADGTDVGELTAATSTAAWLAAATRVNVSAAHGLVGLARALDAERGRHEPARVALAAGVVNEAQVREILGAVDRLPEDLGPVDKAQAEGSLVRAADQGCDAKALRHLGKHLLEVVAPDLADAHLARVLEAEERVSARKTCLRVWDDGHGSTHGTFTLPTLAGAMLTKALHALASPRRPGPYSRTDPDTGRPVPGSDLLGQALVEYVSRYPLDRLPLAGGVNATVVVTMTKASLLDGLAAANLDTGGHLSAGQARRLACAAGIIPAVLGGSSEVLDLGRRRRLHTKAQRLALNLQQGGQCAALGCDRPAGWLDAHHPHPWSQGGHTTLTNGILICPRHHTKAHDPNYATTYRPDGTVTFHRRT